MMFLKHIKFYQITTKDINSIKYFIKAMHWTTQIKHFKAFSISMTLLMSKNIIFLIKISLKEKKQAMKY
jgi:hypothetical protein